MPNSLRRFPTQSSDKKIPNFIALPLQSFDSIMGEDLRVSHWFAQGVFWFELMSTYDEKQK